MATINVQAGVAGHVIDQQPEQAAHALEAIKQASKEGLRELRGILNVLRQADEHDPTHPRAAALAQLDCSDRGRRRRAGLPTTVDDPRRGTSAATDRRSRRLPDRPGVTDQRAALRRPRHRQCHAFLRVRTTSSSRSWMAVEAGHTEAPARRRARACRDARTGHGGRRDPPGRARVRKAAFAFTPDSPSPRHDPRPARRRSGADPRRLSRAAGLR